MTTTTIYQGELIDSADSITALFLKPVVFAEKKPTDDAENTLYTFRPIQAVVADGWEIENESVWPSNGQFDNPQNPTQVNCYSIDQAIEADILQPITE